MKIKSQPTAAKDAVLRFLYTEFVAHCADHFMSAQVAHSTAVLQLQGMGESPLDAAVKLRHSFGMNPEQSAARTTSIADCTEIESLPGLATAIQDEEPCAEILLGFLSTALRVERLRREMDIYAPVFYHENGLPDALKGVALSAISEVWESFLQEDESARQQWDESELNYADLRLWWRKYVYPKIPITAQNVAIDRPLFSDDFVLRPLIGPKKGQEFAVSLQNGRASLRRVNAAKQPTSAC